MHLFTTTKVLDKLINTHKYECKCNMIITSLLIAPFSIDLHITCANDVYLLSEWGFIN